MYKVYEIPVEYCYDGTSLVAANSAEEANEFIKSFKESDPNNECDSFGYGFVDEHDIIPHIYADIEGIINYGIRYFG